MTDWPLEQEVELAVTVDEANAVLSRRCREGWECCQMTTNAGFCFLFRRRARAFEPKPLTAAIRRQAMELGAS